MPVAAIPAYLGQNFDSASPGLRFGMYLRIWGINRRTEELLWSKQDIYYARRGQDKAERELTDDNKSSALADACKLTPSDQARLKAVIERQALLANSLPNLLSLQAIATAPFTTGLGNEHPLENGFAFLTVEQAVPLPTT